MLDFLEEYGAPAPQARRKSPDGRRRPRRRGRAPGRHSRDRGLVPRPVRRRAAAAAPAELLDQTVGFLGIQEPPAAAVPARPAGVGSTRTSCSSSTLPLILVVGAALWLRAARRRAARSRSRRSRSSASLYLLGRTDEFHLVPLAVVLPVMLVGRRRARARRRRCAIALRRGRRADRAARPRAQGRPAAPPARPREGARPAATASAADAREVRDLRRVLRAIGGPHDLRRPAAVRPGHRRQPAALRARRHRRTRRATTSCSPASSRRPRCSARWSATSSARRPERPRPLARPADAARRTTASGASAASRILDDYLARSVRRRTPSARTSVAPSSSRVGCATQRSRRANSARGERDATAATYERANGHSARRLLRAAERAEVDDRLRRALDVGGQLREAVLVERLERQHPRRDVADVGRASRSSSASPIWPSSPAVSPAPKTMKTAIPFAVVDEHDRAEQRERGDDHRRRRRAPSAGPDDPVGPPAEQAGDDHARAEERDDVARRSPPRRRAAARRGRRCGRAAGR